MEVVAESMVEHRMILPFLFNSVLLWFIQSVLVIVFCSVSFPALPGVADNTLHHVFYAFASSFVAAHLIIVIEPSASVTFFLIYGI
jgi:hypothetical protein